MTPEQAQALIEQIQLLQVRLDKFERGDRFLFTKNIEFPTEIGVRFGTTVKQKFGFWNAIPVGQQSGTGATIGMTTPGGTNVQEDSAFAGAVGTTKYTIHGIVAALKNVGILKM